MHLGFLCVPVIFAEKQGQFMMVQYNFLVAVLTYRQYFCSDEINGRNDSHFFLICSAIANIVKWVEHS